MDSRRYIKRVWRVPQDRGAAYYLGAIVVKSLIKHGWPAKFDLLKYSEGFRVLMVGHEGDHLPPDFARAVSIAVAIAARTYRIDVSELDGDVTFNRLYRVAAGGHFRENKL